MEAVHQWIEPALEIARLAGSRILEIYATDFRVGAKADDTPITRADLAAHRAIEAGLRDLEPGWPVLSEESVGIAFEQRRNWDRYWLVDPLDGTREFVNRNGQFCINIALIDHERPILGLIYAPVDGHAWYAASGKGAWKLAAGETRPAALAVRAAPPVPVVVGSRSRGGRRTREFLAALGTHELVRQGSAIKFGLIAEGRGDVYARLGRTSEWDTAAGQIVVEEAGGQVTDLRSRPLRYNRRRSLLNPDFLAFGDAAGRWYRYLPDTD